MLKNLQYPKINLKKKKISDRLGVPRQNRKRVSKWLRLGLIRRTFPALFANKVAGVQPMKTPVGLSYSLNNIKITPPTTIDGYVTLSRYIQRHNKWWEYKMNPVEEFIYTKSGYAIPLGADVVYHTHNTKDKTAPHDYIIEKFNSGIKKTIDAYLTEVPDGVVEVSLISEWDIWLASLGKKELILNVKHPFRYVSAYCRKKLSGSDE